MANREVLVGNNNNNNNNNSQQNGEWLAKTLYNQVRKFVDLV